MWSWGYGYEMSQNLMAVLRSILGSPERGKAVWNSADVVGLVSLVWRKASFSCVLMATVLASIAFQTNSYRSGAHMWHIYM